MMKKNKEFFLITFSHSLTHMFIASLAPLLPLIRAEFDLSYTLVGVMASILSLCFAFSSIPAGIISDKMDRIKLMLSMFLLVGILSSAMVLMSTFVSVFLLLIFLFLSLGIFHPSAYPYLSDIHPEGKGGVFGFFETGGGMGRLIAPLVAGVVGSYFGWRKVYTLWALAAFATTFLFYQLLVKNMETRRKNITSSKKNNNKKPNQKGLFFNYPHLKAVYLATGLFGFVVGGSITFLPLFLTDVQKLPVSVAGGMLAVFLAGGLVGNVIGGKYSDRWGPKKVLELGFLIPSFLILSIPFVSGFSLMFILLPAGIAFFMILPASALFIGSIDTNGLGLAYGINVLCGSGLGASSRFLCGVISDVVGIRYVFFLLAATAFFAGIFVYLRLKKRSQW